MKTLSFKNLIGYLLQNKHLLFDFAITFAIRVVAATASFFMTMVLARQLGAYQAGNFFLCIAFITIGGVVLGIGGTNQLLKYTGIHSANNNWNYVAYVVWKIMKPALIFSILSSIVLIFLRQYIAKDFFEKEDISSVLFWMLLCLPVYTLTTLLAVSFQGIKKVAMSICLQGLFIPVTLIIFVLILKPTSAVYTAELYFFASLFTLVIGIFYWFKAVHKKKVKNAEKPELPQLFWKSTLVIWGFSILQVSIQWGGQFIAGIYSKPEQLAQLAIAQRTSILISFILIAANLVSAPRFASLYSQGKMLELRKYAVNTTRLMTFFASPIVVIMLFFPDFIMSLFGEGFKDSGILLRILVIGQYINVITGSVSYLLLMTGHERELRNITLVGGICSILLNVILIKMYGVLGASVAIATSVAIQNLMALKMVNKKLGFNMMIRAT